MCDTLQGYVHDLYRTLHAIPEPSMQEYKTTEFLTREAKENGFQVVEHKGSTGLLAVLDSGVPGPTLGVRGDIDALLHEVNGEVVCRHTCGHDSHASMVMAAGREIMQQGIKRGKLILIFQPGEETLAGAQAMIASGLIENIDELFGIHIRPVDDTSLGHASPAIIHGSSARIRVTIRGFSAHTARPHLATNAAMAAVLVVNAINAIHLNPGIPNSVKVTHIKMDGTSMNVIHDKAILTVDLRSHDTDIFDLMRVRVAEAVQNAVAAIGATAELDEYEYVPGAQYDEDSIALAREAIVETMGEDALIPNLFNPGGDDFHHLVRHLKCKAVYFGIGADAFPGLHHPDMELNPAGLDDGVKVLTAMIKKRLC